MIASQNMGMDTPNSENILMNWSKTPFLFTAAAIPAGMDITIAIKKARIDNSTVAGQEFAELLADRDLRDQ